MKSIFSVLSVDEDISHSVALVRFGEAPPKPSRGLVLVAPLICPVSFYLCTRYLKVLPGFKSKDNPGIPPSPSLYRAPTIAIPWPFGLYEEDMIPASLSDSAS